MISPKEYNKIVTKNSPKSKLFVNCIKAFLIGGAICTIGQGFTDLYAKLVAAGWTEETETDAFGGENKFYVNAAKTIKLTLTDNFGASLTLGLSVYTAPSAQA